MHVLFGAQLILDLSLDDAQVAASIEGGWAREVSPNWTQQDTERCQQELVSAQTHPSVGDARWVLWRWSGQWLAHRLAIGEPVPVALDAAMRWLGVPSEAREIGQAAIKAWIELSEGFLDLARELGRGDGRMDSARDRANDKWLTLAQGVNHQGRSFMRLLLTLTNGRTKPVCSVRELQIALFEHPGPFELSWEGILTALMLRGEIGDSGTSEEARIMIKGTPLARLVAAGAALVDDAERTVAEWIQRAVDDLGCVLAALNDGWAPILQGPSGRWNRERVENAHAWDALPPVERCAVALTYVIDLDAANFAQRVMPSVKLWPKFQTPLVAWAKRTEKEGQQVFLSTTARARANRKVLQGDEIVYRVMTVSFHGAWDQGDRSLTLSRLFTWFCGAMVEGCAEWDVRPRQWPIGRAPYRQGLLEELEVLRSAWESSADLRRARERERGLRHPLRVHVRYSAEGPWEWEERGRAGAR